MKAMAILNLNNTSRHGRFFLLCHFLLFVPVVYSQAGFNGKCFYPNGKLVSDYVPCNETASVSPCCKSDEYCLSNGLCWGAGPSGGVTYRGGCTDQEWKDSKCPNYCLFNGFLDSWANVVRCDDSRVGCAGDCSGRPRGLWQDGTRIIPGVAAASKFPIPSSTTASSIPTPSSAGNSSLPVSCNATTDGRAAAKSKATAAGLATGLPLGALSLALAAALLLERRKNRQAVANTPSFAEKSGLQGWNVNVHPHQNGVAVYETNNAYAGAELSS